MINEGDFSEINKKIEKLDKLREEIIIDSRQILKLSKQAIYSIHRNNIKEAETKLKRASILVEKIKKIVMKNLELLSTGSYNACLQEYVEAQCYYSFVVKSKIPTRAELKIDHENYLLGICDLTGELQRRAVHLVIYNKASEVKEIWEVVNKIYEKFLEFDLRNSELRKKSDSIKWNLKRIEEILYDLSKK